MSLQEPVLLLLAVATPMALRLVVTRAAPGDYLRAVPAALVALIAGAVLWSLLHHTLRSRFGVPPPLLAVVGVLFFIAVGGATGLVVAPRRAYLAHQRGTRLLPAVSPAAREASGAAGVVTLAGVPLTREDETKHIKVIGTTGTGKSTAIREVLAAALKRGDRAIIADPDGGYIDRFYDPAAGDLILSPFDARSCAWDLFGEIAQPYDVEQLARALIPDNDGPERSWRNYARVFFTSVCSQLWSLRDRAPELCTVAELYRLLTVASNEELAILLQGTPARPYLDPSNERMFGSIRSVTATYVSALAYPQPAQGTALAIRHWIRAADAAGNTRTRVLFLPYSATQIAALRSLIAAWLRLAIFETMNGPERSAADPYRLWFLIDELDALGAIDGLKDALARLRKFGGSCLIGFQAIAQVSTTCGAGDAQTIVENCANTLILRCSASERGGTAQFASRLIGDREVIRRHVTWSRRPGEWRATRSVGEQHVTEPAVLPSEVEQLPDLTGFLKVASRPVWQHVRLLHHP